jgi:hypothetical protein
MRSTSTPFSREVLVCPASKRGYHGSTSKLNMSDSSAPDHLEAKHERNREQRMEGIKRWVQYIRSEPPERWGPQQNAVVNGQLDAAQSVGTSAAHQQHVKDVAEEILGAGEETNSESE